MSRNAKNYIRGKKDDKKVKRFNSKQQSRNNSNKNMRQEKEAVDTIINMSKSNPYSWYDRFPQFTKDAGNVAFANPLGQRVLFPNGDELYMAGIMRLGFYPTVGYSADMNSPINRSAVRFITYLRDIQKAASTYDGADVVIHLMALDSCYMFHSLMKRAYQCAQLFTPLNKYYPRALLQSMGFDLSIANNLAEFRAYINRFGLQLGAYTIPNDFDITNRHQWMCEGLYLDSNTTRAQTYVFVPEGFWQYNNTVTTGSQLDFVPWQEQGSSTTTLHTLAQVQALGDQLIGAIRNDQDAGKISGDIYTAYSKGGGSLKRVEEVPELSSIVPIYDEVVLSQIENATLVGIADATNFTISQDPTVNNGAIIFTPGFRGNTAPHNDSANNVYFQPLFQHSGQLMNMHMDSPTPEQVIEASRLMVSIDVPMLSELQPTIIRPTSFGADVISRTAIFIYSSNTGVSSIYSYTNGVWEDGSRAAVDYLAISQQFDWAPLLYVLNFGPNQGNDIAAPDLKYVAGDVDNIAQITYPQLEMMHEAAMLSLFDVPQMGH